MKFSTDSSRNTQTLQSHSIGHATERCTEDHVGTQLAKPTTGEHMTAYSPIERHGIVGNLATCALVSDEGVVDWCCIPHLESPSVFGSLLDDDSGGRFAITPSATFESEQRYIDRTNVLETTFTTDGGEATVTDFMPVHGGEESSASAQALYRCVTGKSGSVAFDVRFEPRFDYARAKTMVETVEGGIEARGNTLQNNVVRTAPRSKGRAVLMTDVAFTVDDDVGRASLTIEAGETSWFVFRLER